MSKEAMQQALDALEPFVHGLGKAILRELREALAAPEPANGLWTMTGVSDLRQVFDSSGQYIATIYEGGAQAIVAAHNAAMAAPQPVQLPIAMKTHGAWDGLELLDELPDGTKLYTTPQPQRQPLSYEDIERIFKESAGYGGDDFTSFAQAIEQAHGITKGKE